MGDSLALRLVAILFPIFGIVAAGYFYARHHKPEMAVANRLNMDVFVPALVFAAMAGKSFDLAAFAPLALGGFLVLASCGLLAWPIAKLLGIHPKIPDEKEGTKVAVKCDMCKDIKEGPVCVRACPVGAALRVALTPGPVRRARCHRLQ